LLITKHWWFRHWSNSLAYRRFYPQYPPRSRLDAPEIWLWRVAKEESHSPGRELNFGCTA
jgi:hypothetical protein